jgi:hypothetical protein
MIHEKDKVAAFLCERPKAMGISLELNVRYVDGTTTMYINRADNSVPQPNFFRVTFDESGASSGALYDRLLRERAPEGIKELTADNVFTDYQSAWTRMMRWEKFRGLTASEVDVISKGGAPKTESSAKAPASAQDSPCPHCGQFNEPQRDVCWACYKFLREHDKPRVAADAAATVTTQGPFLVERDGAALQITWKWGSSAAAIFLFAVAIGWFSLNRFMANLGRPAHPDKADSILLVWAIVPALMYAYYGLAHLLNRIVIRVDAKLLTMRHGPVSWPGARTIPIAEIDQIYSEEYVSHEGRGGGGTYYRVKLIYRNGKEVNLLPGVSDPTKAEFIVNLLHAYIH